MLIELLKVLQGAELIMVAGEAPKDYTEEQQQQARRECWDCLHRAEVPGSCHIECKKPDEEMTGNQHGISSGWFTYPLNYGPVWKTKLCNNFEEKGGPQ